MGVRYLPGLACRVAVPSYPEIKITVLSGYKKDTEKRWGGEQTYTIMTPQPFGAGQSAVVLDGNAIWKGDCCPDSI